LQAKLLRVLQEQEFERLGSARTIRADFRLVAATNRNLAQMVEKSSFRNDLFYRLNVFPIEAPPLRERTGDIPLLVWHLIAKFAQRMNKVIESMCPGDMETLARYSWPGNIRELQNVIERAVILTGGTVLDHTPIADLNIVKHDSPSSPRSLADAEREHILRTLRETDWVIGGPSGAAALLQVRRTTLIYKMRRLGICRPAA
jgi:formate hydrogenlyase transcriptional activator